MVIPVNEKEEKAVSTLTMWDIADISGGYQLIGSPILYSTQTVEYVCEALNTSVLVRPYVIFMIIVIKNRSFSERKEL